MNFNYTNPTMIQFGEGKISTISTLIPAGQRVLFLYGGGSIKKNGVYDQVVAALSGHQWFEFSGVEANPTVETLNKAVDLLKGEGLVYILAVGGGSVIDGAKYIAAAACYDGDGWDFLEGKCQVLKALPIGAVLTLPATGSESNPNAVITKAATKDKLDFGSKLVQPRFAVMDPTVMKTLPQRQLMNGIVDAWVHICEQYVTYPVKAMVQDAFAEGLLRTLKQLAETRDNQDDTWRENLMWAANQALNGLISAGVPSDWATHVLGHELTALYGVDHARSLSIVQPWLFRHEIEKKRAKLEQMGRNVFALDVGDDLAERTIDAIEAFYQSLEMETQLSDYGTDKATAVDALMAQLKAHGRDNLGEHQSIDEAGMRSIFELAVA
ncbi:MAG: NADH-dependent alcohol dehydrogenase [Alteromonadaceae bacterium]|nr:MAG: NADH-dependent alcohol dehydrogenase [Alteromonadaceae bacterium]